MKDDFKTDVFSTNKLVTPDVWDDKKKYTFMPQFKMVMETSKMPKFEKKDFNSFEKRLYDFYNSDDPFKEYYDNMLKKKAELLDEFILKNLRKLGCDSTNENVMKQFIEENNLRLEYLNLKDFQGTAVNLYKGNELVDTFTFRWEITIKEEEKC